MDFRTTRLLAVPAALALGLAALSLAAPAGRAMAADSTAPFNIGFGQFGGSLAPSVEVEFAFDAKRV